MLLLRVALRCGLPSVRHFEEQFGDLTWRELQELGQFERYDPPLGQRLDYLFSLLCAVVANSRMAGKGAKSYKPKDFLPQWGGPRKAKEQAPEKLQEAALQIFGSMLRKKR